MGQNSKSARPLVMICYFMANPMGQNQNFFRMRGLVVLIYSSIGESSGSKSNKNSEDYAFLYTFPYTGYVK